VNSEEAARTSCKDELPTRGGAPLLVLERICRHLKHLNPAHFDQAARLRDLTCGPLYGVARGPQGPCTGTLSSARCPPSGNAPISVSLCGSLDIRESASGTLHQQPKDLSNSALKVTQSWLSNGSQSMHAGVQENQACMHAGGCAALRACKTKQEGKTVADVRAWL
jgi:hypothetical protein